MNSSDIPLLSKEGWLRDQENIAQPPLNAQTGWLLSSRKFGALRGSILTTPSAPIRGGFATFSSGRVHPSLERRGHPSLERRGIRLAKNFVKKTKRYRVC